jgi:cytochrome P450
MHLGLIDMEVIPGLILAGHETTSTVVAWVLFELSTNHNVQVRLRAECSALVLSGAASNNAPLDADALGTLDKLPLLDAVIRETLRLHAPFTGALRTSLVDDEIPLAKPFVDAHGVSHDTIPFASLSPRRDER